ncbi:hypothetical protein F53441_10688 [Fusarium austroafricanum]|uniref:Uncharacterized protein n=1 Tax=Fusarium austroafricanum TaxID=2364996 RepID=A0A8H4K974_9HYPO|nr:hypothetical protein F53441_10688 [Fusarium austroafricanum]
MKEHRRIHRDDNARKKASLGQSLEVIAELDDSSEGDSGSDDSSDGDSHDENDEDDEDDEDDSDDDISDNDPLMIAMTAIY